MAETTTTSTGITLNRRATAQLRSALRWLIETKGGGNLLIVCTRDLLHLTAVNGDYDSIAQIRISGRKGPANPTRVSRSMSASHLVGVFDAVEAVVDEDEQNQVTVANRDLTILFRNEFDAAAAAPPPVVVNNQLEGAFYRPFKTVVGDDGNPEYIYKYKLVLRSDVELDTEFYLPPTVAIPNLRIRALALVEAVRRIGRLLPPESVTEDDADSESPNKLLIVFVNNHLEVSLDPVMGDELRKPMVRYIHRQHYQVDLSQEQYSFGIFQTGFRFYFNYFQLSHFLALCAGQVGNSELELADLWLVVSCQGLQFEKYEMSLLKYLARDNLGSIFCFFKGATSSLI